MSFTCRFEAPTELVMNLRAMACGVIAALMLVPPLSRGAAPNKTILGLYGQPAAGHDSIRVTENAGGRIGVKLKLYYSNGHTCQLNKDGNWMEDHIAIVTDGLDANHPCKLNLFFESRQVLLKDDGLQCAPVYCGTRGKLDNTRLPKFTRHRQ
jgi:hypothetical protein